MQALGHTRQGLSYYVAPQVQQFPSGLCSGRRAKWEMNGGPGIESAEGKEGGEERREGRELTGR